MGGFVFCLVYSVVSTAKRVCFRQGTRMATGFVFKEAPTISFWLSSVSESMILALPFTFELPVCVRSTLALPFSSGSTGWAASLAWSGHHRTCSCCRRAPEALDGR